MSDKTKDELLTDFVTTSSAYYRDQFQKIGASAKFTWTFNWVAAVLGPIWYGMRGIWNWALSFVILETFAYIQIGRGMFGDLGSAARTAGGGCGKQRRQCGCV